MKITTRVGAWGKLAVFTLLLAVLLAGCSQQFQMSENKDKGDVVLYFFWGDGCPHCAEAKPWLAEMDEQYPDLSIRAYEVWYNDVNQGLYEKMATKFQVPENGRGVPVFYLNDRYWIGFAESTATSIEEAIQTCATQGCADAGVEVMPGARTDLVQGVRTEKTELDPNAQAITLPLIGEVDLSHQSLFLSTLLISFVDGFNPCSLWVLSMLLALTLHTGSRKKVVIIGLIFLTVTAAVYAMFIAGLFTFLSIVNFLGWIQVVVALVALFFASVNIKDYFWYKEGLSFTIADEQKPGIFKRIRSVMDAGNNFWSLAGATVVMAAGVSLVEFSCTAGFPVVWTNLLTSQKATFGVFAALLLVYMLIYQLDEMAIFFSAVFTLKASRLEEKQGRILKLISGVLMLTLAVVMLVNPTFMNSLSGSLVVFAVAFAIVLLVLLFHRRILPSYGIWIGTEAEGRRKSKKRPVRKVTKR